MMLFSSGINVLSVLSTAGNLKSLRHVQERLVENVELVELFEESVSFALLICVQELMRVSC